jgi:hypothetical protein
MALKTIFFVVHTHTDSELFAGRSDKFIGIFSSEIKARAAITHLSQLEGFKDASEGFATHEVELDCLMPEPIDIWE